MAPDLLLITWNRRHYLERTIRQLLDDSSDFRLYCWDNGSQDGTQDIIASLDDPRIVAKRMEPENVGQAPACYWFFDEAKSDVIGKVDDDILLPAGWTARLEPMLRKHPEFGMLGGWVFLPEEWNEQKAEQNIVQVGDFRVLQRLTVQGHSFLCRKSYLQKYVTRDRSHGLPIDRRQMSIDGLISGFPVPPIFLHNMDDPRSEHYAYKDEIAIDGQAALTARVRGFQCHEDYAAWIAEDARQTLEVPFEERLKKAILGRDPTLKGRIKRKIVSYAPSMLRFM